MSKTYVVPSFSPLSSSNLPLYFLEVIKDGCIIDKVDLCNKIYHIFGRQGDAVDVLLEHQSISRQHAIIHHNLDGSLMIMDMKSAQGTFVNKKEIEKDMYIKLNVGDIVKFGQSTRMYVINGPVEFESKETGMYKNTKLSSNQSGLIKEAENNDNVSNWGIRFDDVDHNDDDNDPNQHNNDDDLPDYVKKENNKNSKKYVAKIINDDDINEKDRSIFEKIKVFERKIQNMEEEIRRINNKEFENGLTEGQLKVLSRNQEKISEFENEINNLIQQIQDRNNNRKTMRNHKNNNNNNNNNSDDTDVVDNIVDTTEETADSSTNWRLKKKRGNVNTEIPALKNATLTYEELCLQKNNLNNQLSVAINELNYIKNEVALIASKVNFNDELDNIVDKNLLLEHNQKLKAYEHEVTDLNGKIHYVNKLVEITAPAHLKLRSETNVKAVSDEVSSTNSLSSSILNSNLLKNDITDADSAVKKDELKSESKLDALSTNSALRNAEDSRVVPASKKKRIFGPQGPSISTCDFINDSNNSNSNNNYNYNEYDNWVAPKNQTGDGKTSLNDKYGY